jgi:nucleotide-binding universal stress UspA family protein
VSIRILCAVTFSPSSRRVVAWAASLAGRYDGEVRVFHAMGTSNERAAAQSEADSEQVRGRPSVEIVRIANRRDADLIVMGIDAASKSEDAFGETTS